MENETRRIAVLREQLDQEMVPLFAASIIAYHEVSTDAREVRDELSLDHVAYVTALALSSIAPIYAPGASQPTSMTELDRLLAESKHAESRAASVLQRYSIRRGDLRAAIQKLKSARVTLTQDYPPSISRVWPTTQRPA
jgi:hypothetical protein